MKKNHSKLIVLLLAVLMIFVLSSCGSGFIKNGWDYEAKGVRYSAGFGPGQVVDPDVAAEHNVQVNADGSAGLPAYSLKAPDANGNTIDLAGTPDSINTTTQPVVQ